MCNRTKFYDTIADFPEVGVISRLYVAKDTGDIYVWDGANYVTSDNSIISINSTQNVPYTGVELPVDDGITVGDTSTVQFNDGTIVFYTWDGNAWVVDFVDDAAVSGAGVASKIAFWTDTNTLDNDTNLHWDDVNKRFGIGTVSPTHKLSLSGDFGTGGGKGILINNTNPIGYSELVFTNDTIRSDGDFVIGYSATGAGLPNQAYISNRNATPISFWTNESRRLDIDGNGNVGIGTTSPQSILQAQSTTDCFVNATTTNSGSKAGFFFNYNNFAFVGMKLYYNAPDANVYFDNHYTADAINNYGSTIFRTTPTIPGTQVTAMTLTGFGDLCIGTSTPNTSARLQVDSTTKGFLPPRMTATQASAIVSPAEGLLLYVTNTNGTFTTKGWWGYDGATWKKLDN